LVDLQKFQGNHPTTEEQFKEISWQAVKRELLEEEMKVEVKLLCPNHPTVISNNFQA
jgi:hypothetical protein